MAFRRPEQDRSSPSLGYRLSSNRQPGVEIANNRMPSRPMPRFGPVPIPDMGPVPMPSPMPPPGRGPVPMPSPMPPPGRGPVPMPSPMPFPFPREPVPGIDLLGNLPGAKPPPHMIDQITDMLGIGDRRKERYIADTRGGHQGIGSLTPSNIGVDRGPTTMDPLTAMLDNPQVMRDAQYARELEEQMDPNNFLTNRLAVGEQFGVDPFGDIRDVPMQTPYREDAALDPSDYRTILKILEAGGNPEDYMAANRGGIASLMR